MEQCSDPGMCRRLIFAPGSHLTGEQLLALVLALFIRHRLTAGHPGPDSYRGRWTSAPGGNFTSPQGRRPPSEKHLLRVAQPGGGFTL
jgi:hypothetical protein